MNDAEALAAINAALDNWFRDGADPLTVLAQICQITGEAKGVE